MAVVAELLTAAANLQSYGALAVCARDPRLCARGRRDLVQQPSSGGNHKSRSPGEESIDHREDGRAAVRAAFVKHDDRAWGHFREDARNGRSGIGRPTIAAAGFP